MAAGAEAWAVAGVGDGVTPNVNVLTEALGADLDALLSRTIADLAAVDGEVLDQTYVTADRWHRARGWCVTRRLPRAVRSCCRLTVFGVRDETAVVAHADRVRDRFDELVAADIQPYSVDPGVTG